MRVERGLELGVEIAHAGGALVHRSEDLNVAHGVEPFPMSRDKLGAERDGFREAIVGGVGDDEREIAPGLRVFEVVRSGRE